MSEWKESDCWTCESWVTEQVRCGDCPLTHDNRWWRDEIWERLPASEANAVSLYRVLEEEIRRQIKKSAE